jgi:hypothetical protein
MDERSAAMHKATARNNIVYKLKCRYFTLRLCTLEHCNGIFMCKYAENNANGFL